MEGSSRVLKWKHHLHVLSSASRDVFEVIVEEADRELLTAIAELFLNIVNLTVSLPEKDLPFFQKRVSDAETLSQLPDFSRTAAREIVLESRSLVQRGILALLPHFEENVTS